MSKEKVTECTLDFEIDAEKAFAQSTSDAKRYFQELLSLVRSGSPLAVMHKDFAKWGEIYLKASWKNIPVLKYLTSPPSPTIPGAYLSYMNGCNKLEKYIGKTIAYVFLRDLGRDISDSCESEKIRLHTRKVVNIVQDFLAASKNESPGMEQLYRRARDAELGDTFIWLMEKLHTVQSIIPEGLDYDHAMRKLVKLTVGVGLHQYMEFEESLPQDERVKKMDRAIRLGFCYGLTYPFIDDILDSPTALSHNEKRALSRCLETAITTGSVPDLELFCDESHESQGENCARQCTTQSGISSLLPPIYKELKSAFEYIRMNLSKENEKDFFERAYVFFRSQEEDRIKSLDNPGYSDRDIYIPLILKSASSRLIARSIINPEQNQGFDTRTFYYGIFNQCQDDLTDIYSDLQEGNVTPFTYYLTHKGKRNDLVNPYELYIAVLYYLIHKLYKNDAKIRELLLERSVNTHRNLLNSLGPDKYSSLISVFKTDSSLFNSVIKEITEKATDLSFFDKLARKIVADFFHNQKKEKEKFESDFKLFSNKINSSIEISRDFSYKTNSSIKISKDFLHKTNSSIKKLREFFNKTDNSTKISREFSGENPHFYDVDETIVDAANYALSAGGKRIRPVLALSVGVLCYGLDPSKLIPILRSIEYMHSASLIFDDLPGQDNADFRRGKKTVHVQYGNVYTAELTAMFMVARAFREQASARGFGNKPILDVIAYCAEKVGDTCKGQYMDLSSTGKKLTLEELETISALKTAVVIESALVVPAMLANAHPQEIGAFKRFAFHAGLAFQIKDDILDATADSNVIGKPSRIDNKNNSSTFVTILGLQRAKRMLYDHYLNSCDALKTIKRDTIFLRQVMDFIVTRDH
ncbi:putative Polyprenyl synthetase [Desulfamplus magnetovallimortis]|uniref:Putative Polyprenyl synthetase n=1 Tax=Desulfamplus magnetovallimortis TaxID=1246637 RepID=A0A1W1HH58_9BACT|nr:polyprenyl synthetase family protein [Desulfamplus magnetovallimortis]SLM31809.1 putative Polyprenyl synthetase [Desulfamplus magnetovallimortis]